jgi:response regulator RpfG family c-di-GMP phosphodiesterase
MRILYIEDNPFDADLTRSELRRRAPELQLDVVDTLAAAEQRLAVTPLAYTAVLLDLHLPDGDGLVLLNHIRQRELPLVVVILTGDNNEEMAVSALKAGADDYMIKQADYLANLPATLQNAVQRFQLAEQIRRRRLCVLYAEANPADVDQTRRHLARHAANIQLEVVASGQELLDRLHNQPQPSRYNVLLLDYSLGAVHLLDVVKQISNEGKTDLPVVLVTGQGNEEVALQALKLGASDYVVKSPGYLYRLAGVLENAFHLAELERAHAALEASHKRLQESYDKMIEGWALALELRDHEARGQSLPVTDLAVEMARALGLSGEALDHMRRGALLHDIGKLGVPEAILQKKGPLTNEEWDVMKLHPTYGYQLLYPVELLRGAIDIPYCHHERWDGSGYPHGLKGTDIPLAARIFAVADVWEALNSDRPFRPAWDREHVIHFLREQAGVKFDPAVVDVLLKIVLK